MTDFLVASQARSRAEVALLALNVLPELFLNPLRPDDPRRVLKNAYSQAQKNAAETVVQRFLTERRGGAFAVAPVEEIARLRPLRLAAARAEFDRRSAAAGFDRDAQSDVVTHGTDPERAAMRAALAPFRGKFRALEASIRQMSLMQLGTLNVRDNQHW